MPLHLPQNNEFTQLELLAKQIVEGFLTGLHRSPFHGFSVEFAEHRLYNTGESTRHIDWKQYAKTDKLFVKRYEEETNLRAYLVIDASRSMFFQEKLRFVLEASAALIHLLTKQRDAVALALFDENLRLLTPAKSSHPHIAYLFTILQNLYDQMLWPTDETPLQNTHIAESLNQLAEQMPKRSLVMLFSDLFEEQEQTDALFAALQHLKFKGHEVILFHTLASSKEMLLDYPSRPHMFIDLESGEKLKLNPEMIREVYTETMSKRTEDLKYRALQDRIDFVHADSEQGYHQILKSFLLRRSRIS